MANDKLKYVYIFFLLILVSLLIFLAQGVYQHESKYTKPVEFNRIDGNNPLLGKISEISVRISNDDTMKHNYTVKVLMDSIFNTNNTVEVWPGLPFTFSMSFSTEKTYLNSTTLVERRLHNATFIVYRDDRAEPIDSITFNFD